jgi:outer membrane protein assembly factor BamB
MDKKSELALLKRRSAPPPEATPVAATAALATNVTTSSVSAALTAPAPTGWWMYHGDPEHTGYVSDSGLNSTNVRSDSSGQSAFTTLFTLQLGGPVLSVPSIDDGFIYVGLANNHSSQGGNGGALHKINIAAGTIDKTFTWDLGDDTRDAHSFTGMGSTPMLTADRVYFGAFNGKFYCLDKETLEQVWSTDLRNQDLKHNQPVTNINGVADAGYPPAVMWSSPVVSADGTKLYVGCGEGENPELYSFVFCLDTATGDVVWIYCTNLFCTGKINSPNELPEGAVQTLPPPAGFTLFNGQPIVMGCSVWGSIAYDKDLNRIYCPTGNQQPEPDGNWQWPGFPDTPPPPFKHELPSPGFSNGLLSLDADTGEYKAFFQVLHESNYRESDFDIDIGSSPVIFDLNGRKVVSITCKNGSVSILDAESLVLIKWRQLLPYRNDGKTWIETVDPHSPTNDLNPHVTNDQSNATPGENYSGVFNTAALYPGSGDRPQTISPRLFIGMGGPNYHSASPGIDFESTPFMRAIDLNSATLDDIWPMDNNDPHRYTNTSRMDPNINTMVGMYTTAGESGLGSPAVVNDVVFCATSKVSLYAFDVRDGTLLWWDDLGMQTDGYNGGYGYCIGPAIWKNYVVAGALIMGRDGGVLKIYGLQPATKQ